jgi:outer membrane protein OmpA-like peptidoglycan-associated protein
MNPLSRRPIAATARLTALAFLSLTGLAEAEELESSGPERVPARAGTFALKLEPGLAIPLSSPQRQLFDIGGSQTLKALWTLNPYWDIGPSVTFAGLPATDSVSEAGTAWTFGGSVRFKRPHHAPDGEALRSLSPWLDVDALYVRTGGLNRPGFAAAVGVAMPLGVDRVFWLGPFVRYLQILQGTPAGFDNHDARLLSIGLSLEVGTRVHHQSRFTSADVAPNTPRQPQETTVCPDRDGDGLLDNVDRCPDTVGPPDSFGCRSYAKIVVKPDKLELKEKLYFAWDQATLSEESFPVLDEVAQAMKDNKQFRVQVGGHSSSDGAEGHNQSLSARRADSVVEYLVAHGVQRERLSSKGFASSAPSDTNKTAAGRENNRRVEFVVYFTILGDGTKAQ